MNMSNYDMVKRLLPEELREREETLLRFLGQKCEKNTVKQKRFIKKQ